MCSLLEQLIRVYVLSSSELCPLQMTSAAIQKLFGPLSASIIIQVLYRAIERAPRDQILTKSKPDTLVRNYF